MLLVLLWFLLPTSVLTVWTRRVRIRTGTFSLSVFLFLLFPALLFFHNGRCLRLFLLDVNATSRKCEHREITVPREYGGWIPLDGSFKIKYLKFCVIYRNLELFIFKKMDHSRPLFLYFRLFNTQLTVNKCSIQIIFCRWLDSNGGPQVSEGTAQPTAPHNHCPS